MNKAVFGLVAGVLTVSIVSLFFGYRSTPSSSVGLGIAFAAPNLQTSSSSFLEQEAGIAVYTKLAWTLPPEEVWPAIRKRLVFVESEASDYLVGPLRTTNYSNDRDVHIYVDKVGWAIAYYLKGDHLAKIIDPRYFVESGKVRSLLEVALGELATAAQTSFRDVSYYHFAYPSARSFVVGAERGSQSFTFIIPSGVQLLEASYIAYDHPNNGYTFNLFVDGIKLNGVACRDCLSPISLASELVSPSKRHVVTTDRQDPSQMIAVALVYK